MIEWRIPLFRKNLEAKTLLVVLHYSSIEISNITFLTNNFWMKEQSVNTSSTVHGCEVF